MNTLERSALLSERHRAERLRRLRNVYVDEFGCWLYRGDVSKQGYAVIGYGGHREAYEEFVGPAEGVLDHTCHNPEFCENGPRCFHRRCINPGHLELVTPRENFRRGALGKGLKPLTGPEYRPNIRSSRRH